MIKKTKATLLIFALLFVLTVPFVTVSAESGFVIDNGILLSYTGSQKEITIPSEVVYIGDNAFRNNTSVEKVVLGKSVMGIGNCAFYGCTSLSSLEQTESVGAIGAYAFYNTLYLNNQKSEFVTLNDILIKYNGGSQTVAIPSNVRVISPYTFAYNRNINSVIAGNNVEEIGEGAFYMCGNLSNVDISENTAVIGGYAFYDTPWLKNDQRDFLIEGRNILIDCKSKDKNITIPDDVVTVGTGAFYMSGLESVTFSENTKVIGMRSFMGCENLKSVNINDGILLVDTQAFYNCPSLEKAEIASSVQVINDKAFVKGNLIIYGEKGSVAESFAKENDIPFNGGGILGDLDGDGVLTISDATQLQSYIAGIKSEEPDMSIADVNGDGSISITDVSKLQMIIAGEQ